MFNIDFKKNGISKIFFCFAIYMHIIYIISPDIRPQFYLYGAYSGWLRS